MPKKPAGGGKFVKATDAVSDDRNWIGRIQNELNCTATWQKDWGFLSGGTDNISVENATKNYSIDDKIRMIEEVYFFSLLFNLFKILYFFFYLKGYGKN